MNAKKNNLLLGVFSLFFVLTAVGCKKDDPKKNAPAKEEVKFELQVGGAKKTEVSVAQEGTVVVDVKKLDGSASFVKGDIKPSFPAGDASKGLSATATDVDKVTITASKETTENQTAVLTVDIKGHKETITVKVTKKAQTPNNPGTGGEENGGTQGKAVKFDLQENSQNITKTIEVQKKTTKVIKIVKAADSAEFTNNDVNATFKAGGAAGFSASKSGEMEITVTIAENAGTDKDADLVVTIKGVEKSVKFRAKESSAPSTGGEESGSEGGKEKKQK